MGIAHFGILAQHTQIGADDRKQGFSRVDIFQSAYPFYGTNVESIATDSILSICRIDDNATVAQYGGYPFYLFRAGVIGIYAYIVHRK